MDTFHDIREAAWEANRSLPGHGLVRFSFGNVSVVDRERGVFAIKPSGVPYESLLAGDLVVVGLDGRVVDGALRPSSDTATHAVLYREFVNLGAIVHTHSTHAVAWAQALRAIPVYGTTHADHLPTPVPCTPVLDDERILGDYETETGRLIVETFRDEGLSPGDVEMVLVGGHGPFTWGPVPHRAVYNSVMLEEIARMAWLTESLDAGARSLKSTLVDRHWHRKHGSGATYGQP
jgi:L-ribulose-5-phosphate 4-epimerase